MALQQELYLRDDLQQLWQGQDAFAAARAVSGTIFRTLEQRQTLAFSHSSRCYFIKRHRGVTWKEIFKNLLQLRMPVVSAHNEFQAIQQLQRLGIKVPSVAAYGRRGWFPATFESFLVTDDVGEHVSLEDHCRHWAVQRPTFAHKQELLLLKTRGGAACAAVEGDSGGCSLQLLLPNARSVSAAQSESRGCCMQQQ